MWCQKMRKVKIQRILILILLIAVCSLGYWIGYISSKQKETATLHQQLQELVANSIRHDKVDSNPIQESHIQHAQVNKIAEPHITHVQGIHEAHITHIKDHLHPEIHSNSTVPKKTAIRPLKEEEPGGVEWEHIKNQKEEGDNSVRQKHIVKPGPTPPKMAKFDVSDAFYSVIHAGVATRVHGQIHEKLKTLPDSVPKEAYIFEADKLSENPRLRPSIGNGHVGTVVHGKNVFMNGLYNGLKNTSHRAAIPSSCSFNITGTQPETEFTRKYRLNVGEGVYSEVSEGPGYTLTQRMYAHRNLTSLIVVEVDLVRTQPPDASSPRTLIVKLNKWTPSYDLTFNTLDSGYEKVSYKVGRINEPEHLDQPYSEVHVLYDKVPDKLEIRAQTPRIKWVFLTALAHTKDKAFEAYKQGLRLLRDHDALYAQHVAAWGAVWGRGRVDIVGNPRIARAVYGSWYYILSSMPVLPPAAGKADPPEEEFVGLSPTGLPYGDEDDDYMGHVFWDQETWMYPPILLLRPDLARTLLLTRKRTQPAAQQYAKDTGYQGLRYPWESARTGFDVTPDQNCSTYELHINGDISLAILQYLYATNDTAILPEPLHFDEILTGIANFWVSKLWYNSGTDLYEIHGVMPPDEDCIKVDNSVYTNEVARISLQAPEYIFSLLGKKETHWAHYPEKIYMPFDKAHDYHPEYDGYKFGSTVKQADAVMLGYPLQRKMPHEVRVNDLKAYAKVTDERGPAMTWPMYCIGWLEVKDLKQAEEVFMKSFDYIHTEFQVWTEVLQGPDAGATNFLTGMGGFLQSILFGYGGIRLRPDRLDLDPELPPDSTEYHIVGLTYRGNTMDVIVRVEDVMFVVKEREAGAAVLHLQEYKTEAIHDLNVRVPVTIKRQKCTVFKE